MLERLKEILAKVTPDTDMSAVTEKSRLVDDLGFDSLAIMTSSLKIGCPYWVGI